MKSKLLIAIAFSLFLFLNACIRPQFCETGYGDMVKEDRMLNDFSGIDLKIDADIYITQSDTQSVKIIVQENILSRLETNVNDEILEIEFTECISYNSGIEIYISMKNIEFLSLESSGSIISESPILSEYLDLIVNGSGEIDLDDLYVSENLESTISGSGDISLEGTETTKNHNIEIIGSGNMNAYSFPTENVNISIDALGNAYLYVIKSLDVDIFGSGSVYYKGHPEINVEILGSGSIYNSND